jgi:glycine cleavage system aminomethyltransferase T
MSVSESASARSPMPAAAGPGFADRSLIAKTHVRGPATELGTAVRADDGGWWCPITPQRTLVLDGAATGLDVTCAYAAIELDGPRTDDVIARFCALDVRRRSMPVGGFRPGSVARTPGFVLRTGDQSLLLLVGWALGEYLWTVVADAAEALYA